VELRPANEDGIVPNRLDLFKKLPNNQGKLAHADRGTPLGRR
jgi:hypothetical protein